MRRRDRPALLLFLGMFLMPALAPWRGARPAEPPIAGQVVHAGGPVAGASVRWQGSAAWVVTDANGRFALPSPRGHVRMVTATKAGYRIASGQAGAAPVTLTLERLPAADNEDYHWLRPGMCADCHGEIDREWNRSAHARAARNPRLLAFIADPDGKSPPGWDLAREHPLGVGVCATCHAPTLDAVDADDDVRHAHGVAGEGVHCDFCHKIADARPDPRGVRFGRDGLGLLRPRDGEQLFYGPLPDAVRPGESFAQLPLYQESRACAPCHEGRVFGVHVYGTYSEWLESPARVQGIQCQGCHMTPTGRLTNLAPGKGGIERNPRTLASHRFPGSQAEMLKRCLKVAVNREGRTVHVTVTADHVGHRVPTGYIDRQLILRVQAFDGTGAAIALTAGPRLPAAAGNGSGQPGWLYAKLLRDAHGTAPRPFWLPGLELEDTRLHPDRPDRRSFTFAAPPARVQAQLWYRRFWHVVAEARGWRDNDVLVIEDNIE